MSQTNPNDLIDVRVPKLDRWIVDAFRSRAKRHGRSLAGELRELLRKEALRPKLQIADELRKMREELRQKYGTFSDSAALIREDRDARG